jgi:hypothetical protein
VDSHQAIKYRFLDTAIFVMLLILTALLAAFIAIGLGVVLGLPAI